ncbi:hypothetical protein AURDEDRAFT_167927 [Auricularia subglabra TFB-10046 SS5]|nr:hypothetical protein AURDEDRAFT_167927 [Auricularia subglabra TFB-10046 SS5]
MFLLSDDGTNMPLDAETARARFISVEVAELVRDMLPNLQNLHRFGCDWYGPSYGIVSALSRELLHLHFAFDLDEEAVSGLRSLENLSKLRMISRAPISVGPVPVPPPHHHCKSLKKWPSILSRLYLLEGPECCARILVPGRTITSLFVSSIVCLKHAREILAPPVKGVPIKVLLLHMNTRREAVLDTISRYTSLENIFLRDVTNSSTGGLAATEASVRLFICSLPRLKQFILTTTMDAGFRPDELDEKGIHDMFKRWTDPAAKSLEHIRLRKVVNVPHPSIPRLVGALVIWTAEWTRSFGVRVIPSVRLPMNNSQ